MNPARRFYLIRLLVIGLTMFVSPAFARSTTLRI